MAEKQNLDTISPEDSKRYMHHYNFPPYSVGEVRRVGGPGRREVGHGALAERALLPVVPDEDEFPYTIRLVSEAISSNGSTSMASVCGSSLALMDAGVPIKAPVAGVAMGLIMADDGRYAILTDIQGVEDFMGDMDFKVAGTSEGITALQMDIKVKGITYAIMEEALQQAKEARFFVLDKIKATMGQPRDDLSPYAPRMLRISIPVDKIGAVIGPGGKTIRSIIEETKATINVENDGTVIIGSVSGEAAQRAVERIEALTKEAEIGAIYTGKVTRLMNFGAFVEILPGKDGLVHISELAEERVESVEDVVSVGDELTVLVTEIDAMGRINLSRRALLRDPNDPAPAPAPGPLLRATARGSTGEDQGAATTVPGGRALQDRVLPPRETGGHLPGTVRSVDNTHFGDKAKKMTRVLIHGVLGRMGREVLNAVCREPDLEPTCGVDSEAAEGAIALPDGSGDMPISPDLSGIIARCRPQVMVDFTNAGAAMEASRVAAARGVNLVVGTTGLTEDNLKELDGLANEHQIGAFVAPNFALGAVLLIHLARGLGKYFDYADIVEMHHETKIDSPSGTAMALARSLGEDRDNPFHRPIPEREPVEDTRGGDLGGVSIHSVRMPGRMAHHEIILGTAGQTLSLKHDTINRECYMPGVVLAVREVSNWKGLVVGLDKLLGL